MLNDRLTAARSIAAELMPLERELDDTIQRLQRLTSAIIDGRRRSRMPIVTGQMSLAELAEANSKLVQARAHVVKAHASLADERIKAGLSVYAIGDFDECPKASASFNEQDNLAVA
jgi:hypothetical protein